MKKFSKLNNLYGWITFVIASVVYLLTIEPTASWWDCGEYIATAVKLQVGHPPGAPTFQMLGRFFSLFAFGDTTHMAMMVNIMSALSSSFTILFLFWSISLLARKIVSHNEELTSVQMYTIYAASFIGSMVYTFSDTFWFSAVEGEVYAMSSLMTAIVFWAILKWESVADEKHANRYLILLTFVMGLSIGVHLLNLLAIPAIAFVFYFKKFKKSRWGMVFTLGISILIIAFIMYFIIPWLVRLSGQFELAFVNGLGLPFNTGTIVYFILLIGLLVWGLWFTRRRGHALMNTIVLMLTFIIIGYSSFLMLVIRANANTPINENAPKDAISLLSYLNREQYGDWPILYGQYWSAPIVDYKDGTPVYQKDKASGKYIVIDDRAGTIPVYDKQFTGFFPREWSDQRKGSEQFYKNWGGPGQDITVTGEDGQTRTLNRPTFGENLKFFFNYQVGHMYLRYFMWNFSGRQNDIQGFGGPANGNWISGIPFLDKSRLGHDQVNLPENMKNRACNKYFMLPLILGLVGLFFHIKRDFNNSLVVGLLFLMTGVAIVVYLNQQPYEPRERDYAYAASFYAFAIWVGIGVIQLIEWLSRKLNPKIVVPAVFVVTLVLVPGIMAQQNWDDHSRAGKYACRDMAAAYLNSCSPQGILFTNGDNDTFPLWYDQEVEGIGTNVRVVNLMLSSGPWYINQMYRKVYDSDPLPFTLPQEDYRQGTNDIVPYYDMGVKGYVELKDLINWIKSDSPRTFLTLQNGTRIKCFPTRKVMLIVDSAACVNNGIVPRYYAGQMADTIFWTIRSNQLYKNDVMLLDLIATSNWKRPLYFAAPSSVNHIFAVDPYMILSGNVHQFMPVKAQESDYIQNFGGVDAIGSYNKLMSAKWGNLEDPKVYVDPESLNNTIRPKTNFLRVAQSMANLGKKKEAEALLDNYLHYFPESKIPYDMYMIPYAEVYYKIGAKAKGDQIINRLITTTDQDLNYYYSFTGKNREYYTEDIQTCLGILRNLARVAEKGGSAELKNAADSVFNMQIKNYR